MGGKVVEINLLGFLCEAFGQNEAIYKAIDTVYQKRKYEFYRLAKEDKLYNHKIITEGSLLQEEYCKKALGILLYQHEHPDDKKIIEDVNFLVKKGWPYIWTYMNHSEISLRKFIYNYSRKRGGLDKMTDDEVSSVMVVLLVLSLSLKKNIIIDDTYNNVLQIMHERMGHYESENRIDVGNVPADELHEIEQFKSTLYKKIGKVTDYTTLLNNISESSNLEMISFLFDLENIASSIFYRVDFVQKDIDEIMFVYSLFHDTESTDDLVQFFIYAMHIKYLLKAYKQSKEYYFSNNKEIMFVELEEAEKQLDITRKALNFQIINNEQLVSVNEDLSSKITRLEKELQEEQVKNNELNGLREFFFSHDKKEDYKDAVVDFENLKNAKIIILGGHEKWQTKMKEHLPEAIFIHADMMNFDLSVVDNTEAIFIYANHLSHAIYYKLINYARGSKKIFYLNSQNEKLALKDIHNGLKRIR